MNKQRLTQLVDEPRKVKGEDLPDLKALTERYPWYSGAHMLLAVGELNAGDVLAEEHLSAAAVALPDRRLLFEVANGEEDPPLREASADEGLRVEGLKVEEAQESSTKEERLKAESLSEKEQVDPSGGSEEGEEKGSSEELKVEGLKVETPSVEYVREDRPKQSLEVSGGLQLEEQPAETPRPRPTNEEIAERLLEQQMLQEAMANMDLRAEITGQGSKIGAGEMEATDRGTPTEALNEGTRHASAQKPSRMRFSDWLQNPDPQPEEAPQTDPGELIDRFIQGSYSTDRPKTEFFSPTEMGKRSLEEESGLITETLARIYEQQGDIAKAIDAYYRLALKIPSKSAYFAALAKKLEEEAEN